MARKKKEEVSLGEPDYKAAVAIIRSEIVPDREELSKVQGDLSASWKRVESSCGVNKKAAKDVTKLLSMSEETRDDYLRAFYKMMDAFDIGISEDLVDAMEGKAEGAPKMPTRKAATSDSALLN